EGAMETKIFDADGHIRERDEDLFEFLEPPFQGKKQLFSTPFFPAVDGWHRQAMGILNSETDRTEPDPDDVPAWLEVMDRHDIEQTVIYPTAALAEGQLKDPDWAVAVCRAYNNYLSEKYLEASPRIKGVALLPMQDVQEAVKELRRAVRDLGMLGGIIAPVGLPAPAGDPRYHPVYAEAEKLRCVIALHGASATGLGFDFFDKLNQARALSHPFCQLIHLTNLVFEGVLEKYPGVRILSLEAGVSWLPFLLDRLDLEWEKRGLHQAANVKKRPSEYLKGGQVYFNCEVKERILPAVISLVGDDKLFYASDYPHEKDQEETIAYLKSREDPSDASKQKILYDNGKRCYGLT
ncbi:MAG: amidohydrolase family protein, partial [Kiloniellales bacterium]|nr:amidohydrolase family protein [Kiloniellales bacterium]